LRISRLASFGTAVFLLLMPVHAVQAKDQSMGFALSGVVEKVLVTPGQKVKQGQALAVLDTIRIKARLIAVLAEAKVSRAIADLARKRFDYAQEQFDAVSLSKVELDTAGIKRDEALARLAKAQAKQTIIQWRLDRSTLRAAQGGRIKTVMAWPGMVVNLRAENPAIVVISVP
jgi:multidrug resistance efflux pump